LNYGYAVVRAAVARACAASGLLPAFGIHHRSRTNPFNLVDDLLEPFRPAVDRMARNRAVNEERDELDVEDRRHMAGILNESIAIGEEHLTVLAATEAVAASLIRAIDGASATLLSTPALPLARGT
jgi:CRISPR-associated protein Cas1